MPRKSVSIDSHSALSCEIQEAAHLVEVHRTVRTHNRRLLHSISGRHLVEILHSHIVLLGLFEVIAHCHGRSELEIRRDSAVHIALERSICIQVVVVQLLFRLGLRGLAFFFTVTITCTGARNRGNDVRSVRFTSGKANHCSNCSRTDQKIYSHSSGYVSETQN